MLSKLVVGGRELISRILMVAVAAAMWSAHASAQAPDDVSGTELAQVEQATRFIRQGKANEAIQSLEPVIAANEARHKGSKREVYCARSSVETLLYMGMAAAAKREAVAVYPTWCDAIFLKGFALIDLGRHAEARKWLERAVAMAPNNAHYRSELAESYKTERNWEKAFAHFEQAAGDARTLSPDDVKTTELARALRGMGFVRIETGHLDEAQKLFEECLRLDPNDAIARSELQLIGELRARNAVN